MSISKSEFLAIIKATLKQNPDWLVDSVVAANDGMISRLEFMGSQLAAKDAMFLSALALCDKKRLSKEVIEHCNDVIKSKLAEQNGLCKLEEDFLARNK